MPFRESTNKRFGEKLIPQLLALLFGASRVGIDGGGSSNFSGSSVLEVVMAVVMVVEEVIVVVTVVEVR